MSLVRQAYDAFAGRRLDVLEELVHPDFEFRPVDGLGLVGETLRGVPALRAWFESGGRRFSREHAIRARRLEQVDAEHVLAVGMVSEPARGGGSYAATVAWVCQVSDGRIRAFRGYPTESDARRALSDGA